jgi:hypothetical protein
MVTKKGEGKIDLGGEKQPVKIEDLIEIKPKPKGKSMSYGYKVFKVNQGRYVSAIESKKTLMVDYGVSVATAKEQIAKSPNGKKYDEADVLIVLQATDPSNLIDTTTEFKGTGNAKLLVFDSIKNAKAFQKTLAYETEIWKCEVTQPEGQDYLLLYPTKANVDDFWVKRSKGEKFAPGSKIFVAPTGTLAVKTLRLISKVG